MIHSEKIKLMLAAIRAGDDTSAAVAKRLGVPVSHVSSRLCELANDGYIERCGLCYTGRKPVVRYRLVSARRPEVDRHVVMAPAHHAGEHTSLTAAFCGDPLPGRSALEKRDAGPATAWGIKA